MAALDSAAIETLTTPTHATAVATLIRMIFLPAPVKHEYVGRQKTGRWFDSSPRDMGGNFIE
jgi:hypothetical protein